MSPPPAATGIAHGPASLRPRATSGERSVRGALLLLAGILLVALNLRTLITGLGALLDEVRTGLHLSAALAGLVTTMPTIAFAGFGALAPWLVRRASAARVLVASMVALVVGQVLRAVTDSPLVFIATTTLALAGVALANILLPLLVKQYFPRRVGLMTGAYTMALTVGGAIGAAAAVPIAHAFGTWRVGLGVWAVPAAGAVLALVPLGLRRAGPDPRTSTMPAATGNRVRPGRTRLGWAMAGYFGMQSLSAYAIMGWLAQLFRDAGFSPQNAGLLLAAVTALGAPMALLMPTMAARLHTLRPLVLSLVAIGALAYVGLALAPRSGAALWVVLLAIQGSGFPLILVAIGLRSRTAEGTVALSAFTQSVGYLISALGPMLVGLLYDATGGWTMPIGLLLVALGVQIVAGLAIARPRFIEDERHP